jgi:hypothetical protein
MAGVAGHDVNLEQYKDVAQALRGTGALDVRAGRAVAMPLGNVTMSGTSGTANYMAASSVSR